MKKHRLRELGLRRETLRRLTDDEAARARGGMVIVLTTDYPPPSCLDDTDDGCVAVSDDTCGGSCQYSVV